MPSKELTNAAKAIYESRNGARCKPWSQLPQSHQAPYLDDAEAARKSFFAALQEPTEGMYQAGIKYHDIEKTPSVYFGLFRNMLAASALGEQSE
ncbi:hypothetical protein [Brucella tritici]|uniref:Uncharacterized protein n=1 Tax=Brucella tritici TaxID=94626 RepID=A0A6L3YBF4_9HYPH|nr:hypothetical protein [Brucella tritici]KAB2674873.1 hypothetical protein F9L08_28225 [Brucella tritici]